MNPKILPLLLLLATAQAAGADLALPDGRILRDFRVIHADAVHVIVVYADGVENVPLSACPSDLQEQYHYDPAAAEAAITEARVRAEALEAEREKAAADRAAALADAARDARSKSDAAALPPPAAVAPSMRWRIVGGTK